MYITPKGSPTPDEIYDQRWRVGGLHKNDAAKLCGVTLRTWHAWEAGFRRMPVAAWGWFQVVTMGLLQAGQWKGWRLLHDQLESPDGVRFTPGDLLSMPYLREQIKELEKRRPDATGATLDGSNLDLHPHLYERLLTLGAMNAIGDLLANLHRQFHLNSDGVLSRAAPGLLTLAMEFNGCQDTINQSIWGRRQGVREGVSA